MQLSVKSSIQAFLKKFFSNLNPVVAIDLGSQRVRIWSDGKILDEPSVVAVDTRKGVVVAVGEAALEISQRLAPRVKMIHPVQGGEIVDPEMTRELLKTLTAKILPQQFFSPTVVVGIGAAATPSQIELLTDLLYRLGAKEVIGVAKPLAAAIGAGVPVADSSGGLVAVIGAGVVEAAVVALGSMVTSITKINTLTNLAQEIVVQLASSKAVTISQEAAEKLVSNLAEIPAAAGRQAGNQTSGQINACLIMGKSVQTGAPEEFRVLASDLTPALKPWLAKVEQVLMELLQALPPELMTDVVTKGLLLTGGVARLAGLDEYLVKKLGIPVALVDEPELAVIKGLKMVSQNLTLYKQSLAYEVQD